ncbi:MAG: amidohydrolase family protein [Gammaproteobacteria bacterium]|nr:amidohydrolase family protein [Gammaproteobacteria bacterium]MYK46032.1 amidohydrolase family protein [Gammaproteobacteria bacterium]
MAPGVIGEHPRTHRQGFLIVNADVGGTADLDVRCRDGRVVEIGRGLAASANEDSFDARGGTLLPGLNDHHIHLFALAAARRSVACGPPSVTTRTELEAALEAAPGEDWIRGVGYHESVAGMLDKHSLDEIRDDRPVRIQHRSGKLWFINSLAGRRLGIETTDGQLFRLDELLRDRLAEDSDLIAAVEETSRLLAGYGITGITDATYTNDKTTESLYRKLDLRQRVNLMGDESLESGSLKIMLDDAVLPDFDGLQERVAQAHRRGRPVAFHCVTRTELVFALAALRNAGTLPGDRIEHASVADVPTMRLLREVSGDQGCVTVVTQPNFIAERGDHYLRDVPAQDHDNLYRCRGFLEAGIPLGGGTDSPYGDPDPWAAMRAAVERRTTKGRIVGANEALCPERALELFLTPLDSPGGTPRSVVVGAPVDFCVLAKPWEEARDSLAAKLVTRTIRH